VTAYYVVEELEDFFPDDFGNDDAPVHKIQQLFETPIDWWEEVDGFHADDFGNDDRSRARAPTGLRITVH
jgi:hypothetical protein